MCKQTPGENKQSFSIRKQLLILSNLSSTLVKKKKEIEILRYQMTGQTTHAPGDKRHA